MIGQTVIWTALPNGLTAAGDRLRLSVYASPRLTPDGNRHLAAFPDFVDWPSRFAVRPLFEVQIETGDGTRIVLPCDVRDEPIDEALWHAMFPPATPVLPSMRTRMTDRAFVGFPAERILGQVRARYQRLAALSAWDLPPDDLLSANALNGLVELFGRIPDPDNSTTAFWIAPEAIYVLGSFERSGATPRDGAARAISVLSALDPETGVLRWHASFAGRAAAQLLATGDLLHVAIVGKEGVHERAFARTTGLEQWSLVVGEQDTRVLDRRFVGGILYGITETAGNQAIHAIASESGELKWEYSVEKYIDSNPINYGGSGGDAQSTPEESKSSNVLPALDWSWIDSIAIPAGAVPIGFIRREGSQNGNDLYWLDELTGEIDDLQSFAGQDIVGLLDVSGTQSIVYLHTISFTEEVPSPLKFVQVSHDWLVALDATSRKELGRAELDGPPSANPLLVGNTLVVGSRDYYALYGFYPSIDRYRRGGVASARWTAQLDPPGKESLRPFELVGALDNQVIIRSFGWDTDGITILGRAVAAVDAGTGNVSWRYDLPVPAQMVVVLAAGRVHVIRFLRDGQNRAELVTLDASGSGNPLWYFPHSADPTVPVSDDGRPFAQREDQLLVLADILVWATPSALIAIDPATGAERWRLAQDFGPDPRIIGHQSALVIVEGDEVVAVELASGRERWRVGTGRPVRLLAELEPWATATSSSDFAATHAAAVVGAIIAGNQRADGRAPGTVIAPGDAPAIEVIPRTIGGPSADAIRATVFHQRRSPIDPTPLPTADDLSSGIDFQRLISAAGEYPALLRRLGLLFDLTVPVDALPADIDRAKVRVIPDWKPRLTPREATANASPWTFFERQSFRPFARPVARGEGSVSVPYDVLSPQPTVGPALSVAQVDIDGAILKLLNTARTLGHRWQSLVDPIDAERTTGLASLRSAGYALLRADAPGVLNGRFNAIANLETALAAHPDGEFDLYADDLTRGYRLDVWDAERDKWFSLHERSVEFALASEATAIPVAADEGWIQPGVSTLR